MAAQSENDAAALQSMSSPEHFPSSPFEGLDHQNKELSMERNALNSEVVKLEDRVDFLEAKMEKMKITHQGARDTLEHDKKDWIARLDESHKLTEDMQRINRELNRKLLNVSDIHGDDKELSLDKDGIIASLKAKLAEEEQAHHETTQHLEAVAGNYMNENGKLRSYIAAARYEKERQRFEIENLQSDKARLEAALKTEERTRQHVAGNLKEEIEQLENQVETINAEKNASEARNDKLCTEMRKLAGLFYQLKSGQERMSEDLAEVKDKVVGPSQLAPE